MVHEVVESSVVLVSNVWEAGGAVGGVPTGHSTGLSVTDPKMSSLFNVPDVRWSSENGIFMGFEESQWLLGDCAIRKADATGQLRFLRLKSRSFNTSSNVIYILQVLWVLSPHQIVSIKYVSGVDFALNDVVGAEGSFKA